ncbi:transcriptional regulator [Actinomadura craniellae]|uniref:Transcriptional regulator n=1 Tax=Actinomadura craniellae TaxID=2231787 RepID=A0A365GVC1_9ACTN|nr:helix-turn-helix transcriptional regulator [Actinomadura craniellae]RAY10745.1 transcriptional regulator [Actinomadura craniellae]
MNSPTVLRRRLAARLRALRQESGLSQEEVAQQVGFSKSKVIRIEKAQSSIGAGDLRLLLDLYEVPEQDRPELVQLGRDARKRGWWSSYNDVFTGSYIGLEADARELRFFAPQLVPGLLQTPDYARAVIHAVRPDAPDEEVDRRIEARTARQTLLEQPDPPTIWAVIDEAVIRRRIGGQDVMRAQLEHLAELGRRPNITVQILSFDAGAHAGLEGMFVLLSFPEPTDPPVAYTEGLYGDLYIEEPVDTTRYTLAFDHIRASAIPVRNSHTMITEAVKELR